MPDDTTVSRQTLNNNRATAGAGGIAIGALGTLLATNLTVDVDSAPPIEPPPIVNTISIEDVPTALVECRAALSRRYAERGLGEAVPPLAVTMDGLLRCYVLRMDAGG